MLRNYLDDGETFDSISQRSYESTVCSEFAEQQINQYRNNLLKESGKQQAANGERLQVVNIRFDAVNIYGGAEGRGDSVEIKDLNEIITNKVVKNLESALEPRSEVGKSQAPTNRQRSRIFLLVLLVLLLISAITFCVFEVKRKNFPDDEIFYVNRTVWHADNGRVGSKTVPRNSLAKRAIVSSTDSEACDAYFCRSILQQRQFGNFLYDDIQENFVIGTDGIVYEGRGFDRQGQMSTDRFGTTFDKDSLEINILCDKARGEITEAQAKSLRSFLKKCVEQHKLARDFKLFLNSQIIGEPDKNLYRHIRDFENFVEVPRIVRNETNSSEETLFHQEETLRSLIELHVNLHAGDKSSHSTFHLVLTAGEVYQMRSFDEHENASDEARRNLRVLLADDAARLNLENIAKTLKKSLEYLIDIGKLKLDYQLCSNDLSDLEEITLKRILLMKSEIKRC